MDQMRTALNSLFRLLGALAIVIGISAVPVVRVAACSCAAMAPDEAAAAADVVFAGTAVGEELLPGTGLAPMPIGGMGSTVYTFKVDGVAKGEVGTEAAVRAGGDSAGCGMSFMVNGAGSSSPRARATC